MPDAAPSLDLRAPIPVRDALLVWLAGWVAGNVVSAAVFGASGHSTLAEAGPGWLLAVSFSLWLPLLAALVGGGRRYGTGDLRRDYGLRFRPIDLAGLPLGAAVQLLVLPAVYWPLRHLWPATFSTAEVEQRARDLWDSAHGAGVVLLVVAVVVGAPLVEELVYRGLIQGAFVRAMPRWIAVVAGAALFAAIHFQPVETPGLFVIGLVLGTCTLLTRRLGMGILTHVGFNAAGLVVVAMVR